MSALNTKNKTIGVIVLTCVFFFDFVTKYLYLNNYNGFIRYSAIPKLLIEIIICIYLIRKVKELKKNIFIILSILVISLIGYFSIEMCEREMFFRQLYNINRYFFWILLAIFFYTFKKQKQKQLSIFISNALIVIGLINVFFMFLGWLFSIEVFRAYPYSARFGYNGFLVKTSEASFFYILLILNTYYHNLKFSKKRIELSVFITASLFIGTKIIWLFLSLLFLSHILIFTKKNKFVKYIYLLGLVLFGLIIKFYNNIKYAVINFFPEGKSINDNHGFFAVLSSNRSVLLENTHQYLLNKWNSHNYLFGGINLKEYGVEFEFIDLFLFLGLLGAPLYLYLSFKLYFNKYFNKNILVLYIILMIVVAMAGNFFTSILISSLSFIFFKNMSIILDNE